MNDFVIELIITYGIVNVVWVVWFLLREYDLIDEPELIDILLPTYTQCSDIADTNDINVIGKWIMFVLYTTAILPGLLLYYLVIGILCSITFMAYSIATLFRYVFRKK